MTSYFSSDLSCHPFVVCSLLALSVGKCAATRSGLQGAELETVALLVSFYSVNTIVTFVVLLPNCVYLCSGQARSLVEDLAALKGTQGISVPADGTSYCS